MGETIGTRLRELLQMRHMTQKELAARSGVTEAAVSRYLKDERQPRAITVASLARALGVDPSDIIRTSNDTVDELEGAIRLIARNAGALTQEQRAQLISSIISSQER